MRILNFGIFLEKKHYTRRTLNSSPKNTNRSSQKSTNGIGATKVAVLPRLVISSITSYLYIRFEYGVYVSMANFLWRNTRRTRFSDFSWPARERGRVLGKLAFVFELGENSWNKNVFYVYFEW